MKILVITNHYPQCQRDDTTKVVHYFCKEWINYADIRVINNKMFFIADIFSKKIKSGIRIFEGVKIFDVNIMRYIPKSSYLLRIQIKKIVKKYRMFLKKEVFIPDVIIVHFPSEQWPLVENLNQFLNVPIIPTFHNIDLKFENKIKNILENTCVIGYRSNKIKLELSKYVDEKKKLFPVKSGVPKSIIFNRNDYRFSRNNLIYVGKLTKQKNVSTIIKSLVHLHSYEVVLNIYGDGPEKNNLKKLVSELSLDEKVKFHGKVSRSAVLEAMRKNDCFVMVSSPETLGIVYLEAMASGLFVIGSKGEGIDGVIKHYENGFLVEPGNSNELAKALREYFSLSEDNLNQMLKRSMLTVKRLTDDAVAKEYFYEIKKGIGL